MEQKKNVFPENDSTSANRARDNNPYAATEPATVAITRQVKPGNEAAFEEALHGVTRAAGTFPGFLGSDVLRPGTEDKPGKKHSAGQQNEWQLILRFDNEDNLKRWEESPVSRSWAARADALTVNAPKVEHVNGLEAWFTLPERNAAPAPPKWKTAIVSALAIYPLISFIPGLLAPLTRSLPMWLANLVTIVLIMPLVTWVVMPLMTRLFRPWLYPAKDK